MNQVLNVPTQQEALQAMRKYVEASSNVDKINAQLRLEKAELEAKYADKLNAYESEASNAAQVVEAYAQHHRSSILQGDAKGANLGAGKIGWKSNPPKLVANNWDEVLTYLKRAKPELVRTVEEVDKKALLEQAKEMKAKDLEKIGLAIQQEEKFFIKF